MKKSITVLLHTGYWIMYGILLIFILMAVNAYGPHAPLRIEGLGNVFLSPFGVFTILPAIFGFYSAYKFIFPKYLQKKKWGSLVLSAIIAFPVSAVSTAFVLSFMFGPKIMFNGGWGSAIAISLFMTMLSALHGIIAVIIRGFITWYGDIKIKEDLNKKNYEMELELVKSQISPHFLFNTINNIDVLIQKDSAKASEYLNKLSDMMRFMLYETKTEKIELKKEIEYIEKYIELQKIRTSNNNYINYSVKGVKDGHSVEPMLFIPFIENAFKHADKRSNNAIAIRFDLGKDKITFECENQFTESSEMTPDHKGIGNELIKKRLSLLYKNRHDLQISRKENVHKVKLELLNEN